MGQNPGRGTRGPGLWLLAYSIAGLVSLNARCASGIFGLLSPCGITARSCYELEGTRSFDNTRMHYVNYESLIPVILLTHLKENTKQKLVIRISPPQYSWAHIKMAETEFEHQQFLVLWDLKTQILPSSSWHMHHYARAVVGPIRVSGASSDCAATVLK
jgi:hypothetical protein